MHANKLLRPVIWIIIARNKIVHLKSLVKLYIGVFLFLGSLWVAKLRLEVLHKIRVNLFLWRAELLIEQIDQEK